MNADMLNRGTEDSLPLSLSLFFLGGGGERPLRPPLDPPLVLNNAYRSLQQDNHSIDAIIGFEY